MDNLEEKAIIKLVDEGLNSRSESHKLEFKNAKGGMPRDIWEAISSFSNTPGGGIVVFGIKEDRQSGVIEVVGGLDLANLQERIVSFINEIMVNSGRYSLKIINYRKQQILALSISETVRERKPCYNKQIGLPGGACVREGNTNRKITDEEMRSFIRYSADYRYDRTQARDARVETLSAAKIEKFLKDSARRVKRSFADTTNQIKVWRNLGIIAEFEGGYYPTVAGYMIFAADQPQELEMFSRYLIRCVRYSGTSPSTDIIDRQDIFGTLDEQIDLTYKFVLRNIAVRARLVGTKRVEDYAYPKEAIREIIANAIIHRDYLITGSYIHVNVFSDRIEFLNPGTLPPGITVDNMKESQFSRNEVMAKILADMDYMEEFGRGIDLVYAQMAEFGLVEPLFKNSSNMFKVTMLGESFKNLNDRQVKIWHYLQDNQQITARLAAGFFPEMSRASINKDLRGMVEMDLLVPKGSSSMTYYVPKY